MSEEKAAEKVLVKLLYLGVNDTPKDADIAHKWYVLQISRMTVSHSS